MYKYFVQISNTQAAGPLNVYIQYVNTENEQELYRANVSVEELLTGIEISVNTEIIVVRIVNLMPCCEFEVAIPVSKFLSV